MARTYPAIKLVNKSFEERGRVFSTTDARNFFMKQFFRSLDSCKTIVSLFYCAVEGLSLAAKYAERAQ